MKKFFLSKGFLSRCHHIGNSDNCDGIIHVRDISILSDAVSSEKFVTYGCVAFDGINEMNIAFQEEKNSFSKVDLELEIASSQPENQDKLFINSVIMIKSYSVVALSQLSGEKDDQNHSVILVKNFLSLGQMTNEEEKKIENSDQLIDNGKIKSKTTPQFTHTLAQLVPNLIPGWIVEIAVLKKTEIKNFCSGNGRFQRFKIRDLSGSTEMVVFNELVEDLTIQSIQPGKCYRIQNGKIQIIRPLFKAWPTEFCLNKELILTSESRIVELELNEQDIINRSNKDNQIFAVPQLPSVKSSTSNSTASSTKQEINSSCSKSSIINKSIDYSSVNKNFHTSFNLEISSKLAITYLIDLDTFQFDSLHNILCCVLDVEKDLNITRIRDRPADQQLTTRKILVVDTSNRQVKVTFWGREAEQLKPEKYVRGTILLFNNIKLKSFNGVSLSKERGTTFKIIDCKKIGESLLKEEASKLYKWFSSHY